MNTDKSSTHQHTVRGQPTTNTGVHSHGLTATDGALAALTARITKLEAEMANVVLTISKITDGPPLPPPVPPPIEPTPGTGTVRYISPTGNDAADGLIGTPWRTINKFVTVAKAGDTLYCRGGTYYNHPFVGMGRTAAGQPTLAGTADAPITIRNYPGETPIFSGGTGSFMGISGSCTYVVLDGLRVQERGYGSASSLIYFGAWETDGVTYTTLNITVRNCYFAEYQPAVSYGHCLYPSGGARWITVEDCTFVGQSGFTSTIHAGVHAYGGDPSSPNHNPAPKDILVQRNIFLNWETSAVVMWDYPDLHTTGGSVLHNTFVNCANDIAAARHGTLLVRDNATANANTSAFILDPNDAAYTTADHNAFSCTFTADYHLAVGSNGHDAASDGTDCGALDN